MLRIPHSLDSRLTEGGEFVQSQASATLYSHDFFLISVTGTHFCYRFSKPQVLARPKGLGRLVKFNYLIGSRTRDLWAYIIVPQPLRYRVLQMEGQY
jgi:hypothetical protein